MVDLVGHPPPEYDGGTKAIFHQIHVPDWVSLLAVTRNQEDRFPLLHRILRAEHGADAVFSYDGSGQERIVMEIRALREQLETGRLDPTERESFAGKISVMETEAGGHLNTVGASLEAAIRGLLRLGDFLREVTIRGWYMSTDPD